MWYIYLIILILIFVNGFFAAAEMALVSISKRDLEHMVKTKEKNAMTLKRLLEDSTEYLSTIQVAVTLAGFLSSAIAGSSLAPAFTNMLAKISINIPEAVAMVVITLILSYITLVFGELVPKKIALTNSKRMALRMAPFIKVTLILTKPFVALLSISTKAVLKLFKASKQTEEEKLTEAELKEMIISGQMEGLYQKEERKMLERVLRFDDLTAEMIMTRSDDIIGVDITQNEERIKETIAIYKYSRVPAYDTLKKNILGVLVIKDITLNDDLGWNETDIKKVLRPMYKTEANTVINKLFQEMRNQKHQMAFVFEEDEFLGIVTLEDIIEELLGNIYDEHDDLVRQSDDFSYIVDGDELMKDLTKRLGIAISKEEMNLSLNDYLNLKMSHKDKETIIDNIHYKVLKKHKNTIKQVRIVHKES